MYTVVCIDDLPCSWFFLFLKSDDILYCCMTLINLNTEIRRKKKKLSNEERKVEKKKEKNYRIEKKKKEEMKGE